MALDPYKFRLTIERLMRRPAPVSEPLFFRSECVLVRAGVAQLAERFLRKE